MKDTNNGNLICRLTKDAELTFMQSGSAKLDFSVAFTTSRKNGDVWTDETNYLNNLTLWGKTAERLSNYLKKGVQVSITYHLKVDSYEKDGQKKSVLKPIVDDIQLLGSPKGNGSPAGKTEASESFPEDNPFESDKIPF